MKKEIYNGSHKYNDLRHGKRFRQKHSKRNWIIMLLILITAIIIITYFLKKEGLTWQDVIETTTQTEESTTTNQNDYTTTNSNDNGYTSSTTSNTTNKTTDTNKTSSTNSTSSKQNTRATTTSSTTTTATTSSSNKTNTTTTTSNYNTNYTQTITKVMQPDAVGDNQIIEHIAYKLSYNDKYEQADWVYYLLTKARINGGEERTGDFCEDTSVKLKTALKSDYTNSGYDRGHLCPSADVRDDLDAQKETFYMSNMSPQLPEFNRGIWKDLEEQTRRWAQKHDSIYVVTGPILKGRLKYFGTTTKVYIPKYFYKILYTPKDGGHIIAFLLPNNECKGKSPNDYIVTVDSVESFSGLNFFPKIKSEKSLEKKLSDINWWKN